MTYQKLIKELEQEKNPAQAKILSKFFKTGKGEYGEGDIFWGIKVPVLRSIAKKHTALQLKDLQTLMNSPIHEHRLSALFILTYQFPKTSESEKQKIVNFYLKNAKKINNWDLVDLSAPKILGEYYLYKPEERQTLYQLAGSNNLWEKRIAMLSTYTFIKNHQFEDALKIAEILQTDTHDLIHKAVGWMLREIGKIDQKTEEDFLKDRHKKIPRTMLRYAIEKFEPDKKKYYMKK